MAYGPTLKNTSNRTSKLKWLLVAVVVLAVLGLGGFFGYRWYMDSKAQDPVSEQNQQESTQDEEVGVQDNLTPSPSTTTSPVSSIPDQEQQASNSTGITISSPSAGSTVKAGTKLEGTAPTAYTKVSYRIQSDERGLVGQGELNVVKGKYSGTIGSGGASGNGYIEVFVVNANGNEDKHTKVTVKLGG